MDDREKTQVLALSRAVIGALLFLAPDRSLHAWTGRRDASPQARMAARGLGARDVALGIGALMALESDGDARAWLEAGAIADAADAVSTLAAFGEIGGLRRWLALGVSAGAAVLGLKLAASRDVAR